MTGAPGAPTPSIASPTDRGPRPVEACAAVRGSRTAVDVAPIAFGLVVAGGALCWIGLRHHEPLIFLAGALAPLALLLSFFVRPRVDQLTVTLTGPARAAVDDVCAFTVRLTAPPGRSLPGCRVAVGSATLVGVDPPSWLPGLPRGGAVELALRLTPPWRGVVDHVHVLVSTSAPFGLVRRRLAVTVPHRLLVHPAYRPAAAPSGSGQDGEGPRSRPDRHGTGVHGVREYRPGDPTRAIAWRATARRGRLVVVDHERFPRPATALLLSGPGPAPADSVTWEDALAEAAWTAVAGLGDGSAAFLRRLTPHGPVDLLTESPHEVLDWFAEVGDLVVPAPDDEAAFRRDAGLALAGSGVGPVATTVHHLSGAQPTGARPTPPLASTETAQGPGGWR